MAIFKKKDPASPKASQGKKEEKTVKAEEKAPATTAKAAVKSAGSIGGQKDVSWVLRKPRITEKSAISAEKKVYVFEVDSRATKKDISQAVNEAYKVSPLKVNIAKVPAKKVTRRSRAGGATSGYKAARKKAYIYLKKGDSIEFV